MMKELQEKVWGGFIKSSWVDGLGSLLNWVVEEGKGMPRVVVGLVISGHMGFVRGGGFQHKSGVGEVMVFAGCGILGGGGLLAIIGVLLGGCDCGRYDYMEAGVVQSGSRWRYSLHLVIIGVLIGLVGISAIVVGVIEASRV